MKEKEARLTENSADGNRSDPTGFGGADEKERGMKTKRNEGGGKNKNLNGKTTVEKKRGRRKEVFRRQEKSVGLMLLEWQASAISRLTRVALRSFPPSSANQAISQSGKTKQSLSPPPPPPFFSFQLSFFCAFRVRLWFLVIALLSLG